MKNKSKTIAIIGAGASGVITAYQLKKTLAPQDKVLIFSKETPGLGKAYSTVESAHLLNVPVEGMSALADKPLHLYDWLKKHSQAPAPFSQNRSLENQFISRKTYGLYIQDLLNQCLSEDKPSMHLIEEEIASIQALNKDQWQLTSNKECHYTADKIIFALGNFEPTVPSKALTPVLHSKHYQNDPWQKGWLNKIPANASVLIIGTGLTMIDLILSLYKANHQGQIMALSRRGLTPLPHHHSPSATNCTSSLNSYPSKLTALFKQLRKSAEKNSDWRLTIDNLRPYTQSLWQNLSYKEQRKFLKFLRPYWDVHRHRIAPEVANLLEKLKLNGQLTIRAGRLINTYQQQNKLGVVLKPRHKNQNETLCFDYIINATGPAADIRQAGSPLINALIKNKLAQTDPHHLGLDVDKNLNLKVDHKVYKTLFAIGPLTKGALWETIAVPDIRLQAKKISQVIASIT